MEASKHRERIFREEDGEGNLLDTWTAQVSLGEQVLFEYSNCDDISDARKVIDEFVKSQGWMPHSEWQRLNPLRYKMWIDEDCDDESSTFCDQVCTDLLTGQEVFRYDLGDPANTNSEYGGISDRERFENRGLNRSERISLDDCKVKD